MHDSRVLDATTAQLQRIQTIRSFQSGRGCTGQRTFSATTWRSAASRTVAMVPASPVAFFRRDNADGMASCCVSGGSPGGAEPALACMIPDGITVLKAGVGARLLPADSVGAPAVIPFAASLLQS